MFRTCVERGGAVRSALVIGDLDHVEYDYIITVLLNASVRDLQRYVDASNHSLLDELLDDLGETSRKIFVFCNVPQQTHSPPLVAMHLHRQILRVRRIFLFSMQRFPIVASEPGLCIDDMHEKNTKKW